MRLIDYISAQAIGSKPATDDSDFFLGVNDAGDLYRYKPSQINGRAKGATAVTASGGVIDLSLDDYNERDVDGTVDITSMVLPEGKAFVATFTDEMKLVHHDTNFPLKGKTDIRTIPGDRAVFIGGPGDVAYLFDYVPITAQRIPRVTYVTTGASITPNCDTTDILVVSALNVDCNFVIPSGTPRDRQKLEIYIVSAGGSLRNLTFDSGYETIGCSIPTFMDIDILIKMDYNASFDTWQINYVGRYGTGSWQEDIDTAIENLSINILDFTIPGKSDALLASVVVNTSVGTKQNLYTVGTSKEVIITKRVVRRASGTLAAMAGDLTFGFNAGADDIVGIKAASADIATLTDATKSLSRKIPDDTATLVGTASQVLGCKFADTSINKTVIVDIYGTVVSA